MDETDEYKKFLTLIKKTNRDNPRPKDLEALREFFDDPNNIVKYADSLAHQSQCALLDHAKMSGAAKELIKIDLRRLEQELDYKNSSVLERLLIENITTCYLRYHLWEYSYNSLAGEATMTVERAHAWEQLLSSAQRRYFRSIEMLVKVRRLGINIQVNIATNGGQQINLN